MKSKFLSRKRIIKYIPKRNKPTKEIGALLKETSKSKIHIKAKKGKINAEKKS